MKRRLPRKKDMAQPSKLGQSMVKDENTLQTDRPHSDSGCGLSHTAAVSDFAN